MYLLNLGKPVEVPKLNENQAIELGANILGEGIIFVIAAAILVAEYVRQQKKEALKEEAKVVEMNWIKDSINDMFFETQKNSAEIKELSRHIHFLESELKKFPPPQPPSDPTPVKPKLPEEKTPSPTNINYLHQSSSTLSQIKSPSQDIAVKKGSILAALNYLEDELLIGNRDHYIEEQSSGILMDALDYLDVDVFRSSSDNNVILAIQNAPYASRFC